MSVERGTPRRRGLGMGLSALLGDDAQLLAGGAPDARLVPIERLRPRPSSRGAASTRTSWRR